MNGAGAYASERFHDPAVSIRAAWQQEKAINRRVALLRSHWRHELGVEGGGDSPSRVYGALLAETQAQALGQALRGGWLK